METQLLCNGKRLAIIHDDGSIQKAYIIEHPLLERYSVQMNNDLSLLSGKRGLTFMNQGPPTINTDLSFIGMAFNYAQGKNLLVNMFDNYSISDLFKIINDKIEERK